MRRDVRCRREGVLKTIKLLRHYNVILAGDIGLDKGWLKLLSDNDVEAEHTIEQENRLNRLTLEADFFNSNFLKEDSEVENPKLKLG